MSVDKRREPREPVSLPVEIDPEGGITVDLSNSGLSFETSRSFSVGDQVLVTILLSRGAGEEMRLRCQGTVVRVEQSSGGMFRVGASVEWLQSMDGLRFDVS